jgi:hypothetical protein
MAPKYRTFADALTAKPTPRVANDNRKPAQPRYRGTLPALRWLYDNHPDLAPAMASAVKSLARTDWNTEAVDGGLEMRPTIGEIVRAASTGDEVDGIPVWLDPSIEKDGDGHTFIRIGSLKFDGNELVEYGRTRKDRKLEPRERMSARATAGGGERNAAGYVALRGAVPSPLHAEPYQRPISTESALVPMYDPQRGVEANRALLRKLGVDGSVPFDRLPFPATKCPTAIAPGAEFMGGVVGLSGNSSSGAILWESRDVPKGEVRSVVEAVASGAALKDIGERMGYGGGYADRAAKKLLVESAEVLRAANDNNRAKSKKVA